jgi:aminocarboxymuconate-semialdehyde decarboxylase
MTGDKVILGSDYPFPLGEHQPGKMIKDMSELDDNTKKKILGINACDFLGIKPEDYL